MKNVKYLLLIFGVLIFYSCSNCKIQNTKERIKVIKKKSLLENAVKKYGKKYSLINNKTNSHTICIGFNTHQKAPVENRKSFFIYDLVNKDILFEDSIINGNVSWKDENIVVVSRIPGIIKKDSEMNNGDILYYYNVINNKKIIK